MCLFDFLIIIVVHLSNVYCNSFRYNILIKRDARNYARCCHCRFCNSTSYCIASSFAPELAREVLQPKESHLCMKKNIYIYRQIRLGYSNDFERVTVFLSFSLLLLPFVRRFFYYSNRTSFHLLLMPLCHGISFKKKEKVFFSLLFATHTIQSDIRQRVSRALNLYLSLSSLDLFLRDKNNNTNRNDIIMHRTASGY